MKQTNVNYVYIYIYIYIYIYMVYAYMHEYLHICILADIPDIARDIMICPQEEVWQVGSSPCPRVWLMYNF